METTLNGYLQSSVRKNWEELALTDFNGVSFQYRDIARKVAKLHLLYEQAGVKRGDKIALCGKNSSQWAVAFISAITYGAVAVPILHEFKADNIHHLVTHSEAKLFYTDDAIWENLDPDSMNGLEGVIRLHDYSIIMSRNKRLTNAREHLNEIFGKRYPERFTPDDVVYYKEKKDELALINYTSGSMGFSKGVMLTYNNLWSNIQFTIDGLTFLNPGDGIVCMLPLAHMYGLIVELLHPLVKGCHVYFLTRMPSPRVILEAFATVRPKLIVTVPLIIEKIVKTKVFPLLDKPLMKLLMHIPVIDDRLLEKIKTQLMSAFGGNVQEIIIGGAALNKDVETFLRRINFPYTVGYGMTECAPLVAYAQWDKQRPGSCGQIVDRMEGRIDSPDPAHIPGELWVRGDNVMKGYYKNKDATDAVMKDGWMNTGDLCTMDSDGFIYIRGRNKNMILGPSGQNIYPEEIEQKLNNMPYVAESLVVDSDGQLAALIYPDLELATKQGIHTDALSKIMDDNIAALNKDLPAYSQIRKVKLYNEEFEKTPKRSIKRYLYQHAK
ncbi:AMP-binding protein [Muribaculum sp. NM65_B17]|uniref:AMP-binding protein n=1 Tax=Muribaculum sp. NM65_B17 TaxID=2516961 RepID=UPI0010938A63|nr:AMP-binding protein [Muribaculum sp. NM65_B17]TGY05900.1 long-chain fatty acid--CoA ligase [Muribaculum sp. NM65_B17]THG43581.1 long-chain fatty acid--CoA ligase [Muribaculaceae bacterium]